MSYIFTREMRNNNISRIYSEREFLESNPDYQRNSDIWDESKKQLFIDSILNDYDIPKLYFYTLSPKSKTKIIEDKKYEYSIIDGKQRLETIWGFIDGRFKLSKDFVYFADETIKAGELSYEELGKKYPRLKNKFDSTNLPIIEVESDDFELIEDMFSRLNEAVPLNSAESRNAIGGPMASVIREEVTNHQFFKSKVKFNNVRYKHREVAARLLFIEYYLLEKNQIFDTKKNLLDNFVKIYKKNKNLSPIPVKSGVNTNLMLLDEIFQDKDVLLRAQSVIPIYYLVIRELKNTIYAGTIRERKFKNLSMLLLQTKKLQQMILVKLILIY